MNKWNYLRIPLIIAGIIAFLLVSIIVFDRIKQHDTNRDFKIKCVLGEKCIVEFEGILTNFSNGCATDGICSAEVDGKRIIANPGLFKEIGKVEVGWSSVGSHDIGKKVLVRAILTPRGYTLVGDKTLYIRLK